MSGAWLTPAFRSVFDASKRGIWDLPARSAKAPYLEAILSPGPRDSFNLPRPLPPLGRLPLYRVLENALANLANQYTNHFTWTSINRRIYWRRVRQQAMVRESVNQGRGSGLWSS